MKLAPQYEFSPEQDRALRKARILEYLTFAYLFVSIALLYTVMGSSQAMKAELVEACLALIPPFCFLLGARICWRAPTERYPYGFHRAVSILFLYASLALLGMGAYVVVDAVIPLIKQEHPTIGMKEFFGRDMWLGWWMILVLLWTTFVPIALGLAKIKHARKLNDKILITDGKMNKADWMSSAAAIAGVLGVGTGLWWADAVAAAFIGLDIFKDGWRQTTDAVTGLLNRSPTSLDNKYLDLPEKVRQTLLQYDWVDEANVRLYEHGHLIFGDGFIEAKNAGALRPDDLRQAMKDVRSLDWRLQEFSVTVTPRYEE